MYVKNFNKSSIVPLKKSSRSFRHKLLMFKLLVAGRLFLFFVLLTRSYIIEKNLFAIPTRLQVATRFFL